MTPLLTRPAYFVLCLAWLFTSCATTSDTPIRGAIETPRNPRNGLETLVIVGTNDIHGTLAPIPLKSRETGDTPPVPYTVGGIAMISSTIQQLRAEHGSRLIWLDAGDQFQGSVESNLQLGAPMVNWFNYAQVTATAIGNHEFDFGVTVLKKRMTEATYPYLAANIFDRSTSQRASFPNTLPYLLVTAGNLKVGILGLSTEETPKTTRPQNVKNYHFESLKTATLREAAALRKMGAQIILITAHAGLTCETLPGTSGLAIRGPKDPQSVCDEDEIVRLLKGIPAGTVDAVVSGHTHTLVHHWIAGVPVIQAGAMGRYLNVIYLPYDWEQKKVVAQEVKIEGPIPICEKVFQNQLDCNGERPASAEGRGPLQTPVFHGKKLYPDAGAQNIVAAILKKTEGMKHAQVAVIAKHLEHTPKSESEMGNLLADAIRHASQSEMSIINNGLIRANFEAGPVTYESIFRAIPFDNAVATLNVNPSELESILRVAESGARGFPSVSGIKVSLVHPSLRAPFDDLSGNGRFELWEVNRLLDVRLANGSPLNPRQFYKLATLDFLALGGDDYAWAMAKIPRDRIQLDAGILARDALIQHMEKIGPVNSDENRLLNPKAPRLIFRFSTAVKNFFKSHIKSKTKSRRKS